MKDTRLAAVSMQSGFGQIEKNLERMESFTRDAALKGARGDKMKYFVPQRRPELYKPLFQ